VTDYKHDEKSLLELFTFCGTGEEFADEIKVSNPFAVR
jgi:hypothetical protein